MEKEEFGGLFLAHPKKKTNKLSTSSFSCKGDYPVCSSIFKGGA